MPCEKLTKSHAKMRIFTQLHGFVKIAIVVIRREIIAELYDFHIILTKSYFSKHSGMISKIIPL